MNKPILHLNKEENKTPENQGERKYKIRVGVMKARELSDSVLVDNPDYGESIAGRGSRPVRPSPYKLKSKAQWYADLEESIKKKGVKSPLFCTSIKEGIFCRYGSSRLWIAKKLNIEVPVIIEDFCGRFERFDELKTQEDVLSQFVDPPATLEINEDGMNFIGCPDNF